MSTPLDWRDHTRATVERMLVQINHGLATNSLTRLQFAATEALTGIPPISPTEAAAVKRLEQAAQNARGRTTTGDWT